MIARAIAFSARNWVLVLIAALIVAAAGTWAAVETPLDAIPDLSDPQVIVYTEYAGQAPQVVEDQVTYPLATALLAVPGSTVVRGYSYFGVSFVYVLFQEGTDTYWARSRVLEYLSAAQKRLPSGVAPSLGPDATGVGWIFEYAVTGARSSLAELRSLQDWFIRFQLNAAGGVAEVAGVGGFIKQYQVIADPQKLKAYGLSLAEVGAAIRAANLESGGSTIEMSGREYMVRGQGYLKGIGDIENVVLKSQNGTPVLVRDVGRVRLGPAERRGLAELNGEGEAAGAIVLQHDGENAREVIGNIKRKLADIAQSLPKGVSILPVYDRSGLIDRAVGTLTRTLTEESLIIALVSVLFLLHVRSALVAIVVLPMGILIAFLIMRVMGITSNIMSLGGIAIAMGAMVDAAIVMIENAHKRLERAAPGENRARLLIEAAQEVGPALFFSLLIITVSFLPLLTLQEQEGRLFKPLVYTHTFALAGAALLSVTLVPVLMLLFVRGRILAEARSPLSRGLIRLYRPLMAWVLRRPWLVIAAAILVLAATAYPVMRTGGEFMPPLNEGTLLYMPISQPGMSITKAGALIQLQDKIIKRFPEVETVFGKAGRAETGTDPAPLEMFETVINLKPEKDWREGMTLPKLISEMDKALQFPGVTNDWTMPIQARIGMLSTGIRTPLGIKVYGPDIKTIDLLSRRIEQVLRTVPGTGSVYADRVFGGHYLDIVPDRPALARYGLSVQDLQNAVSGAIGGEAVTRTVEGRERYGVIIRYPQDFRDSPAAIAGNVLVGAPGGVQVPVGQVAHVAISEGPPSIRTENAEPVTYIYIDMQGGDLSGYVDAAKKAIQSRITPPPGAHIQWSGQYEYLERAEARLKIVIPSTLLVIFALLYMNFGRLTESLIVMLSVPFALTGGFWFLYWMDFNFSVAAAVGFIALAGVAAETGVVMLMYLDHARASGMARCGEEGRAFGAADLTQAIMEGAVERVRPKMMTVTAIMASLLPILWSSGAGSEVMQRIAVPLIGGMASSTILTLVVIPAIYALVKRAPIAK